MALAAAPLPGRRKAETVAGRQPEGLSKGTDTECLTSIVCPARAAVCVCLCGLIRVALAPGALVMIKS